MLRYITVVIINPSSCCRNRQIIQLNAEYRSRFVCDPFLSFISRLMAPSIWLSRSIDERFEPDFWQLQSMWWITVDDHQHPAKPERILYYMEYTCNIYSINVEWLHMTNKLTPSSFCACRVFDKFNNGFSAATEGSRGRLQGQRWQRDTGYRPDKEQKSLRHCRQI